MESGLAPQGLPLADLRCFVHSDAQPSIRNRLLFVRLAKA